MAAKGRAFYGEEEVIEKHILKLVKYNKNLIEELKKAGKKHLKRKREFLSKEAKKEIKKKERFADKFLRADSKDMGKIREYEEEFGKKIKEAEKYDEKGNVEKAIDHINKAFNIIKRCENLIFKSYENATHAFDIYPEPSELRREIKEIKEQVRKDIDKQKFLLTEWKKTEQYKRATGKS
ncbi:hypothetical protein GF374_01975 [Candidatus Woesearchaeota archaeon]|nr:hypothetical protein [Candidatus Woesearchaeota archaeon]